MGVSSLVQYIVSKSFTEVLCAMALGNDLEQNRPPSHDKSVNDTQKHVLWVLRPLLGSVLQALMTGAVLALFLPIMPKMDATRSGHLAQIATASPEVLANMHVFVTPADNETEETHHRIAWTKRVDAQTILIQTVSGDIFAVGPKSYLQIGNSTEKQALSMAEVHRRLKYMRNNSVKQTRTTLMTKQTEINNLKKAEAAKEPEEGNGVANAVSAMQSAEVENSVSNLYST